MIPGPGSVAILDIRHIGNPVSPPPLKASLFPLAVEACRRMPKPRRIDTLERIDADHGVKTPVDAAGDDGHHSATDADVELGGAGAEGITGYERRILDDDFQRAGRMRCPRQRAVCV